MKSRQRKKLRKDSIIIVDVVSIPPYMDAEEWFKFKTHYGVIFWDSMNKGLAPKISPKSNKDVFKVIDLKGKKYESN